MRRTDIINAVENVLRALRESGFTSVVETLRGPGDRGPFDLDVRRLEPDVVEKLLPEILKCFAEYKVISSSFSDLEIRILNILGIEYLGDSEVWSEIFQQVRERPAFELVRLTYDIHNSTTFLPTFLKLLQQEDIPQEFFEKDRDKRLQNEISGLTIILIEEKGQRSSPDRLIEVLHSVR
ncbi:MAG: hypothetical protein IH999_11465 [Proteobacteria bacterium]|nr:hypothetical protein [Pseudomonadota bacterium]